MDMKPSKFEFAVGTILRVVGMLAIIFYVYRSVGTPVAVVLAMAWIRDEIRGSAMRKVLEENTRISTALKDLIATTDTIKEANAKTTAFAREAVVQARSFRNGAVMGMLMRELRQSVPANDIEAAVLRAGLKDVIEDICKEYEEERDKHMQVAESIIRQGGVQ